MTIDSDYETWGGGIWNLTINDVDYSEAFQYAAFSEALNEPIQFELEIQGVDTSNTDFDEANIAELDFGGTKAFKGRIINSKRSSDIKVNMEGMGMSFDLLRRTFTKNYTGSDTDTITTEVVGSTMNIGTNTRLNSTDGTVDFRMDEEQKLVGLNRLAGMYGGEWWVDEDGGGNDQFNIDTQRGGGSSVKTYRVSGDNKNATLAEKNTSAGEGNYDGVVVKGYGDGDDQIRATAGLVGDEDEVLEYTDKTLTSTRAAQDKADALKTVHVDGDWTEITVVPADPNEILDIGDVVTVESSDADIASTDYRIVERNYSVDFQGEIQAELVCNNRPSTLFEGGVAQTREETKSQTRNMQGNRNTINESNAEISDQNGGTVIEFNIPQRFVEDLNNNDRTEKVYLDYDVGDYKQLISASDVTTIDDQTKLVDTTVSNFGDVEQADTRRLNSNTADYTRTEIETGPIFVYGDALQSTGNNVNQFNGSESGFTQVMQFNPGDPGDGLSDGMDVWITLINTSTSSNERCWIKVENNSSGQDFPTPSGIVVPVNISDGSGYATAGPVNIKVPENTVGDNYNIDVAMHSSSEAGWDAYVSYAVYDRRVLDNTPDGADRAHVFMVRDDLSNLDASTNANQNNESLPDTNTTTFGKLDNNDLILTRQATGATQVTVEVNGVEITGSPFGSLQNSDIDITSYVNSPGFNTVTLTPDSKGFVKGNIIVDHKLDSNR